MLVYGINFSEQIEKKGFISSGAAPTAVVGMGATTALGF